MTNGTRSGIYAVIYEDETTLNVSAKSEADAVDKGGALRVVPVISARWIGSNK